MGFWRVLANILLLLGRFGFGAALWFMLALATGLLKTKQIWR